MQKQIGFDQPRTRNQGSWFWSFAAIFFLGASTLFFQISKDLLPAGLNYNYLPMPIPVIIVIILMALLWYVPRRYVNSLKKKVFDHSTFNFDREKERLKLENDIRKTLAQIVGGAIILPGLVFTFNTYRLNVAKQDLDREAQMTDRYTKAVDQLGNTDIAVRLGGLYALERVAQDSKSDEDHRAIIAVIASYAREKSPNPPLLKPVRPTGENKLKTVVQSEKSKDKKIESDIQAALTIIGRRKPERDITGSRIILSNTNLRGAILVGDFRNADLTGANLSKAQLNGVRLNGAKFGQAVLRDVNFAGANLSNVDFSNINLSGVLDLKYEQLETAIIDVNTTFPEYLASRREELLKRKQALADQLVIQKEGPL
jgi:hypothetical protein